MHYKLQVDGDVKMNLPSADRAATAARAVDANLSHEHIVRELGEHGIFVFPRNPGTRLVRVAS